jgi:hypothetical protein
VVEWICINEAKARDFPGLFLTFPDYYAIFSVMKEKKNIKKLLFVIFISFLLGFSFSSCSKKKENTQSPGKAVVKTNSLNQFNGNQQNQAGIQNNAESINTERIMGGIKAVTVKISPQFPTTEDNLTVELPEDFVGDITWYVNGEEIIGESGETLPSKYFKRGDNVKVVAVDTSGKKYVAETKIYNANPVIQLSDSDFELDDVLHYHVRAYDPDGDSVKIEVIEAPEGYTFDPSTNTLNIKFNDMAGEQLITFTIKASDPYGGWTKRKIAYHLNISVEKFKP